MSQKYALLYYLKLIYVGEFLHWSEQKQQTGLLKMHIHSLPVGGAFGTRLTAVNKAAFSS